MFPFIPAFIVGSALFGAKKLYDMISEDDAPVYSNHYSDNSYKREQEARQAEEQQRQQQREARQYQQLQQALHSELVSLCAKYLSAPTQANLPSREQIQRFIDFDIEQPAEAKAALAALMGASVQLKEFASEDQENYKKQLRAINNLEQQVRGL